MELWTIFLLGIFLAVALNRIPLYSDKHIMAFVDTLCKYLILCLFKVIQAIFFLVSSPNHLRKPKRCPPIQEDVLLCSAKSLAERIRTKQISSESIVKAYISRIKAVNPVINAIVEDRFALAVEEAVQVDKLIKNSLITTFEIEQKYPLLGVPLTVKESIAVEGMSHTAGRIFEENKVAKVDADIVRKCKEAGAVIVAVSNTPELCMNWETVNKKTGRTVNPYDTRRSVGGSSGGEAALLATAASLIGVGSDICGSLRLPPHYCGVWGHKPSAHTVSVEGHYPSCKNEKRWKEIFILGPMSRYAGDLRLLLDVICENNARNVLRLHEQVPISSIKVYYMENDGGSILTSKIDQDLLEGMRNIVSQLSSKHGCIIKQITLSEMQYSPELAFLTMGDVDDVDNLFEGRGDGSFAEMFRYLTFRSNSVINPILYGMLRKLFGIIPRAVLDQCYERLDNLKVKLSTVLGDDGVLLYPSTASPAPFHGGAVPTIFDSSYMGILNPLGFPATNCPVGINSSGLPFGIQVIAGLNNDRLALTVAEEIERLCGGWSPPPFSNA